MCIYLHHNFKISFQLSLEIYKSMGFFRGSHGISIKLWTEQLVKGHRINTRKHFQELSVFVKINRLSCCFVKAWRYCFPAGKLYCTVEKLIFSWCVPATYFILFKYLLCWNHLISKWTKALFYWLTITKTWHTK